jgi:hypothetical protein
MDPRIAAFSDGGDRLIRILAGVAVLLFVGRGLLPRGRRHSTWAKWARRGAIAAFSAAFLNALGVTLWWAFGASV